MRVITKVLSKMNVYHNQFLKKNEKINHTLKYLTQRMIVEDPVLVIIFEIIIIKTGIY